MAYATPEQIGEWTHQDDAWVKANRDDLARAAALADSRVERKTNRSFEAANGETRIFPVHLSTDEVLVGDLRTATRVECARRGGGWTEIAAEDYELRRFTPRWEPYQEIALTTGGVFPQGRVRVTGDWGWSEVPDSISQAAIMIAANYMARRASPKQVGSSFTGTETDLGSFFDIDIEELLTDYRLPEAA